MSIPVSFTLSMALPSSVTLYQLSKIMENKEEHSYNKKINMFLVSLSLRIQTTKRDRNLLTIW